MRAGKHISVIIPALNEAPSIAAVISALPAWVDQVIVVDNGSTDSTAEIAGQHGAQVISEPVRGYGRACLKGIDALGQTDVVVFLDGDFSDDPSEIDQIAGAVIEGSADLVIGVRHPDKNAITPAQHYGNALACWLIKLIWGYQYHDLGPFRAIDRAALAGLEMVDQDYGWTIEMQIKAVVAGLRIREVPVSYRMRIGVSKISGTVHGVIGAACKIIWTIGALAYRSR
ncbi:MAG: glycosyltransferase family 2 protein [Rhodospirillales bacterium]|jgi:glycosyltransferase involved in cell wall biosynthesis|nr:glycosyltransferase family 2 protein [Rhodospirillales bacterium]MBT4040265.1 glycosyltransferase family 2 protein [Rhodospirillales bacterium]MBT4626530.1 glycosyltransferase family 2 protein [Rhodospirillales bacterium]MBT5352821.1 glycosyltransferase family 2 protein [Rhodospirillales bacterium]MBT6108851.1 glycosyltransferase family 2 protein [Rhodospirillales bacterium]